MKTTELVRKSHRILVIDDNPTIHEDIRKILCPLATPADFALAEAALFGTEMTTAAPHTDFEIDSAYQGHQGLAMVEKAIEEGRPYSMAFVDVRMPPGWDGIETIGHIWKKSPELQIVICTAYSDHSWEDIIKKLGKSDSMVILKKPFDNVEVLQLSHALTKKWMVTRQSQFRLENLEAIVSRRTEELVAANSHLKDEITRRAAIETALRASEERFQKSFESTSVALAIVRTFDFKITEANCSFIELIGQTQESVMQRSIVELQLANDSQTNHELQHALRSATPVQNKEFNIRRHTGEIRSTLLSIVPIQLANQSTLLLALVDVTEQRRVEAQLRQSQKMEAIGQLAAGVAHDFNNLLTIIIGHSSIQLMKSGVDHEISKSFEQVKLAGERASGLTRQLLAFSRKQVVQRRPVDAANTVRNMKKMLTRLLGGSVNLDYSCGANLPAILADESNLEQILLNLVINARDAMPNGGNTQITVEQVQVSEDEAARHADARAGKFIQIAVTDNGTGMDAETQRRLFEPFFTTKAVGKGTGLGLSTVYGIVKQHEGWITVQSELGRGTTFRVFIPITEQAVEQSSTKTEHIPASKNSGTVFVVEDEAQVRDYVCTSLKQAGYKVFDAECGKQALKAWDAFGKDVDLLLTDMVMPNGITGSLLAKTLREIKPTLKVIYMSGYSTEISSPDLQFNEGENFLQKPFGQGRLLAIVSGALKNNPTTERDCASATIEQRDQTSIVSKSSLAPMQMSK